MLGDEDEALDATQDTFVQLLRRRERLSPDFPSSLLFRIATNVCLNRIRDRRRHASPPGEEMLHRIAHLDDTEARLEAGSILAKLFRRHRESTRTIAVLHFLDGMTLEQTAREVGLSVSGVRRRLRELRATLQEVDVT